MNKKALWPCLIALVAELFLLKPLVTNAALPTQLEDGTPLPSLAPMLKEVNPAVVNISTYSVRQTYSPLYSDPFFRRFFDAPQRTERRQQSAGSGVIVDAKAGIVVTNFHVIRGATEVEVSLEDGRVLKAAIVGADPELDIAVLDIDASDLTQVKLANAKDLQVGDFVVAIGNPFGLGQTVTTGVVSAMGRTGLGIEGYENFIQTDASINPGNSGGALVNLRGELVGINTAIISPAGGNVGIGFAIPVNMAKFSVDQILQFGEVRRGDLGFKQLQNVTHDLREAFKLKKGQTGVVISDLYNDTPAAKAGLQPGDVIIAVDNQPAQSVPHLRSLVGNVAIGEEVEIAYLRNGEQFTTKMEMAAPQRVRLNALEGAKLEPSPEGGLVVTDINYNSPAAYSRLRPGDVIVEVNNIAIQTVQDFNKALQADSRRTVLLVNRRGGYFYLVI